MGFIHSQVVVWDIFHPQYHQTSCCDSFKKTEERFWEQKIKLRTRTAAAEQLKKKRDQPKDLGGGNSNNFNVHPEIWGNGPIWLTNMFQMGGEKPPTRDFCKKKTRHQNHLIQNVSIKNPKKVSLEVIFNGGAPKPMDFRCFPAFFKEKHIEKLYWLAIGKVWSVKLSLFTQGYFTLRIYDIQKWQMLDLRSRLGLDAWRMSNEIDQVDFCFWRQNNLTPSDFLLGRSLPKNGSMIREVNSCMFQRLQYPWRMSVSCNQFHTLFPSCRVAMSYFQWVASLNWYWQPPLKLRKDVFDLLPLNKFHA